MAAIDHWIRSARRSDCLMAAFPYNGGMWSSPLKAGVAFPAPGTAAAGSWAVKNGLLAYTNVRTDRGAFESADGVSTFQAETPLDLRGRSAKITIICRVHLPAMSSGTFIHGLVEQGIPSTAWQSVLYFGIFLSPAQFRLFGGFATSVTGATIPRSGAGDHVLAVVLDPDKTFGCVYADGVQYPYLDGAITNGQTYTTKIVPSFAAYPHVMIHNEGTWDQSQAGFKIYAGMIFQNALSQDEIKLFK